METETDFRLEILGSAFSIRTGEKAEYLETIQEEYRNIIDQILLIPGHHEDPLKTAILAGFMLTEELYRLRAENPVKENFTNRLIRQLDEALERNNTK
ncbi:MAG: cell division protein ZapA [Treponema sp.]|jgi:cell division protein ZapA (FtsZ GTPase activity inhibitor)|nr:cell division protein ZapA [Treponema sp.]